LRRFDGVDSLHHVPPPAVLSALSRAELEALLVELFDEIAALKQLVGEQREEIARLKGLQGRPSIRPSGMEQGTEPPKPGKREKRRGRGKAAPRVGIDEKVIEAKVPPGSRFKGYEPFLVQDLVISVLWGSVQSHDHLRDAVLLSDDAGQFDIGRHALCWVHAERLVHKLDTFNDQQRVTQSLVRGLIWNFYASLKAYRLNPSNRRARTLCFRFDRIFRRRAGFATLDRLLARLHANKAALLMVLERPEIPLHTNGSENDIRCYVTRRKVSGGTRSDIGRDSRDAFLSLTKTCDKLRIPVWDYLGSRLKVAGHVMIEALDHYVGGRIRYA
jgi:hypothetical protein